MAETINERIKFWRKKRGLSQAELAEKLGVKSSTYSQCERNGIISCEMLIKVAHILTVDVRELLFGRFYDFTVPKPDIENNKNWFTPTSAEINLLKILRNLPKPMQKDILFFINEKYKLDKYKKRP